MSGIAYDTLQCNPLSTTVQRAACPAVGNPILTGQGRKRQTEIDLPFTATGLGFSRIYDSSSNDEWSRVSTGVNWRHRYQRSLIIANYNGITSVRHYGIFPQPEYFALENGQWRKDIDINDELVQLKDSAGNTTGWRYYSPSEGSNGSDENYNASGKLLSILDRASGRHLTMRYSDASTPITVAPAAGWLIGVSDDFGRQLQITYDSQLRLNSITAADGTRLRYAYDEGNAACTNPTSTAGTVNSNATCNNLTSVMYADGNVKRYLYNEAGYTANTDLPHALTGIIDENRQRYATYRYDNAGRAIGSEHANGADAYTLNYTIGSVISNIHSFPVIESTAVTDPLGTTRTQNFTTILGVAKPTGQSQPGGAGCGPAGTSIVYEGNGNIASQTDFNGNRTSYSYDSRRNLETQRIESVGTPTARTISTEWHANYRLPTRIAEPLRITTFTYDASGNLLSRSEQATTDASGTMGFTATPNGSPRVWRWTYNAQSQPLTTTGPRTDVVDRTTYTYDTQGNLANFTNPLGQVTSFNQYDANGRPLKFTDPNGLITTLTYSPRSWLTSQTISSGTSTETTRYQYDAIGQLTNVTLPDNSAISYGYDAAHRLIRIADGAGNRIDYTLDALGNRTAEQIKDPAGNLARQHANIYDALNRLQQTTGEQ